MIYSWTNFKTVFENIFTGIYNSTIRFKTDQEQRTFAECSQYTFFDKLLYDSTDATANAANLQGTEAIPVANQIIYKLVLTNPLNVIGRRMHISAGGREYLAYLADSGAGDVTEGTIGFTDFSAKLYNSNQNLPPELTELPASGITIYRSTDSTFTAVSGQYPIGGDTEVISSSPVAGGVSPFSGEGTKIGLEAGTYYLVLTDFGSTTDATQGSFTMRFEAV